MIAVSDSARAVVERAGDAAILKLSAADGSSASVDVARRVAERVNRLTSGSIDDAILIQESLGDICVVVSGFSSVSLSDAFKMFIEQLSNVSAQGLLLVPYDHVLNPHHDGFEFQMVKAWFALRGQRPVNWTGPLGWPIQAASWTTSSEDRSDAARQLVEWVAALPAGNEHKQTLTVRTRAGFVQVTRTQALNTALMVADRNSRTDLFELAAQVGSTVRFCSAHFAIGVAAASSGTVGVESFRWQDHVGAAEPLLRRSSWAEVGHLTRASGPVAASDVAPGGCRRRSKLLVPTTDDDDFAEAANIFGYLDAFGVMKTRHDVARRAGVDMHNPWSWAEFGGSSIGSAERDLAAWFEDVEVALSLIDDARTVLQSVSK